ncbi:MAG: response regulator [Nitrospirae bacterium]|nr:response regulator [Nitrospirota bacterium]MCL5977477.1 response regulator [Nitrospirota bacterium]
MSYKLLLADDSLTIQKVVELVLTPEGFEIMAFGDGDQALRAMESFAPNIVLADIEMPKLNGYQLCEKIKNNMATAETPVILLAGAFEPFDEEYAKSVFADDFIIKPFESQELISKVKALLVGFEPSKKEESEEIVYEEEEQASAGEVPEAAVEAVPESPVAAEELKWDEEIPPAEEKPEEQAAVDEEYEAKTALSPDVKDFEGELAEAIKKEEEPLQETAGTPLEMPQPIVDLTHREEIAVMPEKITGEPVPDISLAIKNSVEAAVSGIAPEIIENVTRELVKDLLQSLRGEIDIAIKRIVPEVAETIIKKEIEKITSEIN